MSLILLEEEVMGALFCSWQWQQCKESEQKHMVPAKPQAQNGVTVALTHNLLANTSYGGGAGRSKDESPPLMAGGGLQCHRVKGAETGG